MHMVSANAQSAPELAPACTGAEEIKSVVVIVAIAKG